MSEPATKELCYLCFEALENHIHGTTHALTLTSQVNKPHNLHETICLTDEHWSLLSAKNRENVSNIRYVFMRIGQSKNNLPPPFALLPV